MDPDIPHADVQFRQIRKGKAHNACPGLIRRHPRTLGFDPKPRHGQIRVEMSLILLLSAATATRPGAPVKSASAKGNNKARSYEHISIMRVRDVNDPNRTTTVAMVNLVHIKNSGGKGRRSVTLELNKYYLH